jgi:hypothetical protein
VQVQDEYLKGVISLIEVCRPFGNNVHVKMCKVKLSHGDYGGEHYESSSSNNDQHTCFGLRKA